MLELGKTLPQQYLLADKDKKAGLLKFVCSNYLQDGENITPIYKKPFDLLSKGCDISKWRCERDSNPRIMVLQTIPLDHLGIAPSGVIILKKRRRPEPTAPYGASGQASKRASRR